MSFSTELAAGLIVKDEGVSVATPALSMDFVGAGVSVTGSNGAVTATIGGGGAGATAAKDKLTPTTSGANITLDLTGLAHTFATILGVYKNGQLLDAADTSFGWSRSVNTITVLNATTDDIFYVEYNY